MAPDAKNWQVVASNPQKMKHLRHLVAYYRGKAHPFGQCVRDNTKRFGIARAKKVCAVVKDIGEGGTDWREGSKKK